MRMRKAFWDPFNIVLHLLIPREGTRGAAHTICAVNGDQGCGSHNVATSWDWQKCAFSAMNASILSCCHMSNAYKHVPWNQSHLVSTLWLPQPWSPLTAQIVCAAPLVPSRGIKRCKTMLNGSQNALRMRIQFREPSTTVLHLARAS